MTKTNLIRVVLAVLMVVGLSSGSQAAYAKSASNIAQSTAAVAVIAPQHKLTAISEGPAVVKVEQQAKPQAKPFRNPNNRWMDSGAFTVWVGVPRWIRDLGFCIRKHESLNAGHYKAHNGTSSAAGAYQFLDGTWQGNAKWTKVDGKFVARKYVAANHAPQWIQDAVFIHSIKNGGVLNWVGTHCGYGT